MSFEKIKLFFRKHIFNRGWICNGCQNENFDGGNFCKKCLKILPYNNKAICNHCGRQLKEAQEYCLTCKNNLTETDMARSVFTYTYPIDDMIKRMKYRDKKYLAELFSEYLANVYFQSYMNCDFIVFVPMTRRDRRKRGYNQSELLAKYLSKRINIPVINVLRKTKQTDHQVKLTELERRKNLVDAFKVIDRKAVKNKTILIVDDVTTTGSTAEAISIRLKRAGALSVKLLTVASTIPVEQY